MSKTILIVDDAGFMREVLRRVCFSAGYNVVAEAEDGIEALEKTKALSPDIVLLDLVMPKMSGLQFIEEILKGPSAPPHIVICTTLEEKFYSEKLKPLGHFPVITKPFTKEQIISTLKQLDQHRELKRA